MLSEIPTDPVKSLLSCNKLNYSYPGSQAPAVNSISLRIESGIICGLLGPNGAGKTTLISLLTTSVKPTSGTIHICGKDVIKNLSPTRKLIGLAPQDLALYDNLTARENISYFASMYDMKKPAIAETSSNLLDTFGLSSKADQKVKTYSGGMKRRLNLLLAMIHRPKLLFLDEPTVGIDAQSRNLIIEKLGGMDLTDMAIIYTSHYIEEVERLCKRVIIMDKGKVLNDGSPAELVEQTENCSDLADLFLLKTGKELRD